MVKMAVAVITVIGDSDGSDGDNHDSSDGDSSEGDSCDGDIHACHWQQSAMMSQ